MSSRRVGYTVSGRVIYVMNEGYRRACSECGRDIALGRLFTRGARAMVFCRECRPFDLNEKESKAVRQLGLF